MSSNIKIQRVCSFCKRDFIAKTTVTQYCGDNCAKRAYKARIRAKKIEESQQETRCKKSGPIEELKTREFLSVTQVSKLIGCSRQNVYQLINTGKLKASNILLKKTIVRRSDLDRMINESSSQRKSVVAPLVIENKVHPKIINFSDCYNLKEVQEKYGISETALQDLVKRNEIPKVKKGWYSYVPKVVIDKLLS